MPAPQFNAALAVPMARDTTASQMKKRRLRPLEGLPEGAIMVAEQGSKPEIKICQSRPL
jgi:hypothetical protein